jgi:hypothetical protein
MAEPTALQVVERGQVAQRQTLEPTTLAEAEKFAEIIARSDLAPKDYRGKPANVLVAIQFGKELNIPPMQALQGIAVINGRPSVWGDLMWALVTSHPSFEDAIEDITDTAAKVTLKRKGRTPVTVTFTKADAEKAGLWTKEGPWKTYPKRQLMWRARTFAARDLFPDALKGMVSAEEAMDYTDGPTIDAQPTPAPVLQTAPQQTTAAAAEPSKDEPIGAEKASAWFTAYRNHGWMPADATAFLKDELKIEAPKDSRDIPTSKYEVAMKWANTKSPTLLEIAEAVKALDWKTEEAQKLIDEKKRSWPEIKAHLSALVAKRDEAEKF